MSSCRLFLIIVGCVGIPTLLTLSTLLHAHPRNDFTAEATTDASKNSFRAFFSFHTPSTLFPPSAIISLTDDNSTFFLARPADFGPTLAADGMSGPIWIGSGFGDSGHGSGESNAEGELGCSDIPGWDDGGQYFRRDAALLRVGRPDQKAKPIEKRKHLEGTRPRMSESDIRQYLDSTEPSEDDETDDHLHYPLSSTPLSRTAKPGEPTPREDTLNGKPAIHGDIQSLQEGAEISGRVVLLSRGGCGFMEKVKWAQRRGAIALIVGDNTRGSALITMYARGDTSNVSIPSVFTSHTTAHLLASLIPLEGYPAEGSNGRSDGLDFEPSHQALGSKNQVAPAKDNDRPTFTPAARPIPTTSSQMKPKASRSTSRDAAPGHEVRQQKSWFRSLFRREDSVQSSALTSDSTRPPSSGRLDWFTPKWSENPSKEETKTKNVKADKGKGKAPAKDGWWPASHSGSNDGFEIGVQDWRDPDLVAKSTSTKTVLMSSTVQASTSVASLLNKSSKDQSPESSSENLLSGGSITPGSGQYRKPGQKTEDHDDNDSGPNKQPSNKDASSYQLPAHPTKAKSGSSKLKENAMEEHVDLWVTITPTTMSTSPFFDTLLVLVVSPLVTLTVVYALLLLRSRIRRRRWRAPKSVVDRLPIRTYQTMSCSTTTSSTRFGSPRTSSPSSAPTEPLLLSSTQPRPRSVTTSDIGEAVSASPERNTGKGRLIEKGRSSSTKKRYHSRQSECVVCLEEYIEGKSKVMSLPCGHEFHAECM